MTNDKPGLSSMLQLDTLRRVPLDEGVAKSNSIVGFDGRDGGARPINLMRTQVAKALVEEKMRLVGITSPSPGAGKSFLAVNLAASISKVLQVPTILVDLDLRRGCVADQLDIEFEAGLSDYLQGRANLQDIGLHLEGTNLTVFPTHAISSDSAEAITGERFETLMTALRNETQNALVIFDLPPVFASDDAALSARALDGYIMVVESGKTTRRQVSDAMEMLRPSPFVGTILNKYSESIGDGYGYNTRYYNEYYD